MFNLNFKIHSKVSASVPVILLKEKCKLPCLFMKEALRVVFFFMNNETKEELAAFKFPLLTKGNNI